MPYEIHMLNNLSLSIPLFALPLPLSLSISLALANITALKQTKTYESEE